MKLMNALIAVTDMERSLKFYKEIFDQDVAVDLDWCKSLTNGLTLQKNFERVVGFEKSTMIFRSNTMELYFETEDFDAFLNLLKKHPEVEKVHEARQYDWLQRGIHIYDPDGHMLEISESMYSVGGRLFVEGKNIDEVMKLTKHPAHVVQEWYDQWRTRQC